MTYANETIGRILDQKCREFKDSEALVFPEDGSRYSYLNFNLLYRSLAKGLIKIGVKKGDHIALMSYNSPLAIALSIAAAKIGAVFISLNTSYSVRELEYALQNSTSTTMILLSGVKKTRFFDLLKQICPEIDNMVKGQFQCANLPDLKNIILSDDIRCGGAFTVSELMELGNDITDSMLDAIGDLVSKDDNAAIYYTSGTTGHPKAVMLTHDAMVRNAIVFGKNMNYTKDDRMLLCLPIFHAIGYILTSLLSNIFGSTLVIMERFQTEKALKYIESEHCTSISAVPTMYNFMLNHPDLHKYKLQSLNKGYISGAFCQPSLVKSAMEKLHIKDLYILYGQTEAIAISQTVASDRMDKRLYTIGRPLEGVTTKVIDPASSKEVSDGEQGELWIKSIYLMKGYFKNDEATRKAVDENGWLHTGDIVTKDADGYLSIIGRIKDIIIRGGENIAPAEIEAVFRSCPGIRDVAVVGVPDEALGEEICMFIVKDENAKLTNEFLIEYAKTRLAKFKIPRYIEFVDILPVTASGKVKSYVLKDQIINKIRHAHDADTKIGSSR
ncbi:MAG TPA: AMP-binding protein [Ruminiclostridium sp.]|nr:AMP-binding protein [Ruminiclostridium sp.]